MQKQDPAILRAERLRAIMSMPGYRETIGSWIDIFYQESLSSMAEAKDQNEMFTAQGKFQIISAIQQQFLSVFNAEKQALVKIQKEFNKETQQ